MLYPNQTRQALLLVWQNKWQGRFWISPGTPTADISIVSTGVFSEQMIIGTKAMLALVDLETAAFITRPGDIYVGNITHRLSTE